MGTLLLLLVVGAVVLVSLARAGSSTGPRRFVEPSPAPPDETVGTIAIEDHIDLHGFQPRDIPEVVRSYVEAAHDHGYREVRLIHGRGKGVQRRRVQEILAEHPLVDRFEDAPRHRGGWGATIAWLRDPSSEAAG